MQESCYRTVVNMLENTSYRRQSACCRSSSVGLASSVVDGLLLSTYRLLLSRGVENEKKRIGVLTRATSAPNHAAVLHHRTGNRKLSGMASNVVKNKRTCYWFEPSFHPGGVSLVTSASYQWILGANILSHLSVESMDTQWRSLLD